MATPRSAWGIDVGNRALKAVKVVRGADGLRVDDVAVLEHEHILSNAGDNKESLIQAALQQFVSTHSTKGSAIAIGVSGQSSFARFIKLPPVEDRQIPSIVRFEAIQQIPFPLDDVEWSYQLFRNEESPDVEVGIFAMRKELVNRNIEFFSNIGVDVHVVQMNPLATYNSMYYDQRLKGTSMIIDIGAESTDLIISEGEGVWMRSIQIGGNQFTEALTKSFKLRFDKAEELKRNAATSKYARQILQAMRPVFADLVSEIQRSIGFYSSVHRDSRIQRVLALGGTFRLPGLQKYLQQNLQLEVHRVDRVGAGAPENAQAAAIFNENLLSTVSAYGLALQALGEAKITSTLLPAVIKRERMWRDKTKWFATAAAIFVAAAAIPVGRTYYEQFNFEASQREWGPKITPVVSTATRLDREWSQIETQGGNDRTLIQNVKSVEGGRTIWSDLLHDITSAMPDPGPEVKSGVAETIKKIPRNKRMQVKIEQIASKYEPNLTSAIENDKDLDGAAKALLSSQQFTIQVDQPGAASPGGMPGPYGPMPGYGPMYPGYGGGMRPGMYPGYGGYPPPGGMRPGMYPGYGGAPMTPPPTSAEQAAADAKPHDRGFLIAVNLQTPYANAGELGENIQKVLQAKADEVAKQTGATYKIAKVVVTSAQKVQQPANSAAAPAFRSRGGAARPRPAAPAPEKNAAPPPPPRPGGGGGTDPNQVVDTFVDPVTGESLKEDWQITLLLVAVLDPKPPEKKEGADDAKKTPAAPAATPAAAADVTGLKTRNG